MTNPDSKSSSSSSELSASSFDRDLKNIRVLKFQSIILGLISVILMYFCYTVKFDIPSEYPKFIQFFLHDGATDPQTLFFAFLIAAVGNIFASQLIYNEARREEKTVKRLMAAYFENTSKNS